MSSGGHLAHPTIPMNVTTDGARQRARRGSTKALYGPYCAKECLRSVEDVGYFVDKKLSFGWDVRISDTCDTDIYSCHALLDHLAILSDCPINIIVPQCHLDGA